MLNWILRDDKLLAERTHKFACDCESSGDHLQYMLVFQGAYQWDAHREKPLEIRNGFLVDTNIRAVSYDSFDYIGQGSLREMMDLCEADAVKNPVTAEEHAAYIKELTSP